MRMRRTTSASESATRRSASTPTGTRRVWPGPIGYLEVDDIQGRLRSLLEAGARERQGVTDVGGGKLIAWVEDADGNLIGLQQAPAED